MANVAVVPSEGQILVDIEDMSMLKDIKKAISMVKGVGKITIPRRRRYSSYERSLLDLEEGRVYEAKDVDAWRPQRPMGVSRPARLASYMGTA